ncbi:hypothetical protein QO179_17585 [Bacillus stercoris]|nr:hypothetical protein [Bacillus stercoris]
MVMNLLPLRLTVSSSMSLSELIQQISGKSATFGDIISIAMKSFGVI